MKIFARLLLIPAVIGALAVQHQQCFLSADLILAELGPLLSPEALIVLPTTGNGTLFSDLTKRYIAMYQPDVDAIVRVGTEADIPLIVGYADRSGRPIITANARHGWSLSLNDVRKAIMIDISPLSTVTVDVAANTMTVSGGSTVGDVIDALRAAGKETSAGDCDCIGFVGASLGGGLARLEGLHGLTTDNMISAQLVTADGEMITVSSTSNPDLFWALRGAGHNFGIVTQAVYRVYDQTNGGAQFDSQIIYAPEQLEALFTVVEAFQHPPETNIFIFFAPGPDMTPIILFNYNSFSPEDSARSQLDAAFGHIPHLTRTDSVIPFYHTSKEGCKDQERKNTYSVFVQHYDIAAVRAVYASFEGFLKGNPTATGMVLWESFAVQGVQAVPAADTAFPHRAAQYFVMMLAKYPDETLDAAVDEWLRHATGILHATGGFATPAVYVNHAQGDEGLAALYGDEEWRLEKLKALKRQYDPKGMFNAYHPIPSA